MQKRNTTPKVYYAVLFPPCGAEFHPAFSAAVKQPNGNFRMEFPLHLGYLRSKQSQRSWAQEKAKHIRSWGITAIIVEVAQPEKVIS